MYSQEFKNTAFALYCKDKSFDDISSNLGIAKQTLLKWANPVDDEGNPIENQSWQYRRERINRESVVILDSTIAAEKAKMLTDIDVIYEKTLDAITDVDNLIFTNMDRAVAAFTQIFDRRMKLLGLDQPKSKTININDNRQVTILFEVIEQDQVLGPIFAERKKKITEAIEAKLIESN